MAVTQIYSNVVNPTEPNLSSRFTNAIAFYISAPLISSEVEIDVFLQLYLPSNQVRNILLGKITEQAILLNLTDTESISIIPEEFQDTNLEMALLFLPSRSFTLEAFIITKEVNLSNIQAQLDDIQAQLTDPVTFDNVVDTSLTIANLFLPLFGLPPILSLPALPPAP